MFLPMPVLSFVVGAMAFIAAFNSKTFWGIAVYVLCGALSWFFGIKLGIREWRYQNRINKTMDAHAKRQTRKRR